MDRIKPAKLRSITNETWNGWDYTDEEREFLVAMERYKRDKQPQTKGDDQCPNPTP